MAKGLLVVYTGASGVGKGTIMEKLLADNKNLKLSVSATTRAPRPGEVDGVNYHYITKDEFNNMIDNDLLLEHATYCGNMYGTPKAAVLELLEKGFDVMLEIEVKGYEQVKRLYPECVTIFVLPPDVKELERRLRKRGTETEDVIKERLARAVEEMEYAPKFDYQVINDDVDRAEKEILDIITNIKNDRNKEN